MIKTDKHYHSFTAFCLTLLSFLAFRFLSAIIFSFRTGGISHDFGYYFDLQIESQSAIIFLILFLVTYLIVKQHLDTSKIIITSIGTLLTYAGVLGAVAFILLTIQSILFHTLLLGFIDIRSSIHHIFWYSLVTEIPVQILAVYLTGKIGQRLLNKNSTEQTCNGVYLKNFHSAFCYSFSFAICTLFGLFFIGLLQPASLIEIEGSYDYVRSAINTSIIISSFFIPLVITLAICSKRVWVGKIWVYTLGGFLNFLLTAVLIILFLQFLIFIFYMGTFVAAFVWIVLYYGIWITLTLVFNAAITKMNTSRGVE